MRSSVSCLAPGTRRAGRRARRSGPAAVAFAALAALTAAVVLSPASAAPEERIGLALDLPGETLRALPGDAAEVLGALDTHIRWRPGLRLGDFELADATERREDLALSGAPLAGACLAGRVPAGAWFACPRHRRRWG